MSALGPSSPAAIVLRQLRYIRLSFSHKSPRSGSLVSPSFRYKAAAVRVPAVANREHVSELLGRLNVCAAGNHDRLLQYIASAGTNGYMYPNQYPNPYSIGNSNAELARNTK